MRETQIPRLCAPTWVCQCDHRRGIDNYRDYSERRIDHWQFMTRQRQPTPTKATRSHSREERLGGGAGDLCHVLGTFASVHDERLRAQSKEEHTSVIPSGSAVGTYWGAQGGSQTEGERG
jgi:hypothetical protein